MEQWNSDVDKNAKIKKEKVLGFAEYYYDVPRMKNVKIMLVRNNKEVEVEKYFYKRDFNGHLVLF